MRLVKKIHYVGDKRVVKRFAWLPIYIGRFGYWLEIVYIYQCLEYFPNSLVTRRWVNSCFTDKREYEDFKKSEEIKYE